MRITLADAPTKFKAALEHLKGELNSIRAGRANIHLFDNIHVDAYGQKMPLNQVASINIVDATLVNLQPWDKGNIEAIKKAVLQSNLGINPIQEGDIIKLALPALTEERRLEFIKVMKTKVEEGRIAIRQIRKDVLLALEEEKKSTSMSEDDFAAKEKQLQNLVNDTNKEIDEIAKAKEDELMTV